MTPYADRLAEVTGQIAGIQLAALDESRPMAHLGEQLAEANLGLVRVADPASFSWAGHWLAMVEDESGVRTPVLMFGVPSGPLSAAGASALGAGRIVEGYVIAPLDLERPHGAQAYRGVAGTGVVTALFTAPESGAPCRPQEAVTAIAGVGLEGDRYAVGRGEFSAPGRGGQALTLIAEETLHVSQANGAHIDAADARRNVLTRGIELEPLIGTRFSIGTVVCQATRLAEPCAHLERLTHPGVLRAMVHLGGIRADILTGGEIRVGDAIRPLPEAPS
ncbi:MAG TPA: MOSC domain-containing protein [Gaiellales bacterium]|nr:MOSC domain-containing protein [Gaiellales bacterium]